MEHPQILTDIVVLFGTAVLAAWAFRFLRAPSIIGFLFTGLLIGPSGIGLIEHEEVEQLTEFALVLLLFTIGLELSPRPLMRMGKGLLTAASLQIAGVTVLAGSTLLLLVGVGFIGGVGFKEALILGIAISLSSTAIVLKQLSDRGETASVMGTITTGILLLQDIVAIAVMLFLPILASGDDSTWHQPALLGLIGVAGLAALAVLSRKVLPAVLNALMRVGGREMTALFAVLMAAGGAWLAGLVGWSMALGACAAGLLLAEADARHQLVADILPFRDVLNALFFVSLGMMVNVELLLPYAAPIALAIVVTLVLKAVIAAVGVRVAGWPLRPALHVGLGLCTVSEFGYVISREAHKLQILPEDALSFLVAYAVGTMIIGAAIVPVSGRLAAALAARLQREPEGPAGEESPALHHVIVVGYGVNGENLARVLKATHVPFRVIEMNPILVRRARAAGAEVIVGDATRTVILEHAGLAHAHAVVVGINDSDALRRIISQVRAARPDIFLLARSRFVSDLDALYRIGASEVIAEDFETSIEIAAHLLRQMNVPDNLVEAQIAAVRAGRYGMLRGKATDRAAQEELMQVLQTTATRTHYVMEGSVANNQTLVELDLRAKTGVTVIAVVRNGKPTTNPDPDFRLEHGDVLVLVGAHAQLEAAKAMLSAHAGGQCVMQEQTS
jgi:monovalent cation:H+ antiporter-2, CPA2 family